MIAPTPHNEPYTMVEQCSCSQVLILYCAFMVKKLLHHTQWSFVCNFVNVHVCVRVEEEDGKVEEEERLVCLCVSGSRAKQSLGWILT